MSKREFRDDRTVLSTDAIDEVMKLLASIDLDTDDSCLLVHVDDWVRDDADDHFTSSDNLDELTLVIGLA